MDCQVVAVTAGKGGVGKSLLAWMLAVTAGRRGIKTAFIAAVPRNDDHDFRTRGWLQPGDAPTLDDDVPFDMWARVPETSTWMLRATRDLDAREAGVLTHLVGEAVGRARAAGCRLIVLDVDGVGADSYVPGVLASVDSVVLVVDHDPESRVNARKWFGWLAARAGGESVPYDRLRVLFCARVPGGEREEHKARAEMAGCGWWLGAVPFDKGLQRTKNAGVLSSSLSVACDEVLTRAVGSLLGVAVVEPRRRGRRAGRIELEDVAPAASSATSSATSSAPPMLDAAGLTLRTCSPGASVPLSALELEVACFVATSSGASDLAVRAATGADIRTVRAALRSLREQGLVASVHGLHSVPAGVLLDRREWMRLSVRCERNAREPGLVGDLLAAADAVNGPPLANDRGEVWSWVASSGAEIELRRQLVRLLVDVVTAWSVTPTLPAEYVRAVVTRCAQRGGAADTLAQLVKPLLAPGEPVEVLVVPFDEPVRAAAEAAVSAPVAGVVAVAAPVEVPVSGPTVVVPPPPVMLPDPVPATSVTDLSPVREPVVAMGERSRGSGEARVLLRVFGNPGEQDMVPSGGSTMLAIPVVLAVMLRTMSKAEVCEMTGYAEGSLRNVFKAGHPLVVSDGRQVLLAEGVWGEDVWLGELVSRAAAQARQERLDVAADLVMEAHQLARGLRSRPFERLPAPTRDRVGRVKLDTWAWVDEPAPGLEITPRVMVGQRYARSIVGLVTLWDALGGSELLPTIEMVELCVQAAMLVPLIPVGFAVADGWANAGERLLVEGYRVASSSRERDLVRGAASELIAANVLEHSERLADALGFPR